MRVAVCLLSTCLLPNAQAGDTPNCAEIKSDAARLDCYDQAAGLGAARKEADSTAIAFTDELPAAALDEAEAAHTAEDPPALDAISEQTFGRTAEEAGAIIAEATGVEEVKNINATVTKVLLDPRGRLLVELDNGQRWRQIRSDRFSAAPGDAIVVRRAVLGSYTMQHQSGGRQTKVKRVD